MKEMKVYLAGKIKPLEISRGVNCITPWRKKVVQLAETKQVSFLLPEGAGCDHGGLDPELTVNEDIKMISESEHVIAYLSENEQYGTIVEILDAIKQNIPVTIFINESINKGNKITEKTGHGCTCSHTSEHDNEYWFLLTYLEQTNADIYICYVKTDVQMAQLIATTFNFLKFIGKKEVITR